MEKSLICSLNRKKRPHLWKSTDLLLTGRWHHDNAFIYSAHYQGFFDERAYPKFVRLRTIPMQCSWLLAVFEIKNKSFKRKEIWRHIKDIKQNATNQLLVISKEFLNRSSAGKKSWLPKENRTWRGHNRYWSREYLFLFV